MKKVVVAVVLKDNKVLIIKRKVPEKELVWQFPAGKVEDGETEKEAVKRETKEETNCIVLPKLKIGERIHPITKKEISYWLCEWQSGEIKEKPDEVETVLWAKKDEVQNYFSTPIFEPVLKYFKKENQSNY